MRSATAIAQDLVAIPSINPMGRDISGELYSERRVASYVMDYLGQYGIESELFGADPDHPNLMAFIDAGCSETIMLEAHMDTVPHDGMTIDPFDPVIKDGRLYGRGSCDTKASLAAYLYAITAVVSTERRFTRNVMLAAVHDEEYSFGGSRELAQRKPQAAFAIVGEPTSLDIVYAHKGYCRFFITTKGKTAHSSTPWLGSNAIYAMADVVDCIRAYGQELSKYEDPLLGAGAVNVGRILGGEAVNVVPGQCVIEIDRRLLPGQTYSQIRADLQKMFDKIDATIIIDDAYAEVPAVCADIHGTGAQALLQSCRSAGITPSFKTAHYATDASILTGAGIPCLVFGPGDITMAHTENENISVDQIEQAAGIILNLVSKAK